MASLTLTRKKVSGIALQDAMRITIDDDLVIELNPNETKTIIIPDGNHKFNFYYYKCYQAPFIGSLEIKIDQTLELITEGESKINISNSNGTLSIKHNNETAETKSSVNNLLSNFKIGRFTLGDLRRGYLKFLLISSPLIVALAIGFITLNVQHLLISLLNGIFLISIPVVYSLIHKDTSKPIFTTKYLLISHLCLVAITVINILARSTYFSIASIMISLSIPIIIASTQNTKVKTRVIAFISTFSVIAGITLFCTLAPDTSDRIGETCGACGGDGYFFGEECAACHGFGVYID